MSNPVYAGGRNPVKIQKKGKRWYVYDVKQVTKVQVMYLNIYKPSEVRVKIEFEKKPRESYSYKPYEDRDVSTDPTSIVDDVKIWQSYKIRWNTKSPIKASKARGWKRLPAKQMRRI